MIHPEEQRKMMDKLANQLTHGSAGLVYVDMQWTGLEPPMESQSGSGAEPVAADALLQRLSQNMKQVLHVLAVGADCVLLVGLEERETAAAEFTLKGTAEAIKGLLERELHSVLGEDALPFSIYAGYSLIDAVPEGRLKLSVHTALKQSIRRIAPDMPAGNICKRNEFNQIIASRNITSVYQPIVSLRDAAVLGFEALTRGPKDSPFFSPLELFGYAESHGELYSLDRMAREKAIEGCSGLNQDQRVFINIPAQIIHDPQFEPGATMQILRRFGINPHNVVLEITERSSIEDFDTAKQVLQHYRNQGYQIAIDDAGAGYSSLQAIAELKPDFIKVDRSLIQDIHLDKMKETLLEVFVSFARKMSIRIIAEGIESWEELKKLSQMGVHYGQGFLLGRPAPGLSSLPESIASQVEWINRIQGTESVMQIGHLSVPIQGFPHETHISEVADYFYRHEDVPGTVIVDGPQPVGLVMRENLFQQLAGQYGVSLYWNRPISQLMDKNPLIVNESMPIESVSQLAMAREMNRLYDLVIIASQEKLLGVASIRAILEAITHLRMETARVANPLTGLPGNTPINRELKKRIFDQQPFYVIYADLDYFKWFNDRFGFQKGDQMIQFTADVLQQSVSACGHPHDFVGHIGGDDFIVISTAADADCLCEEIIRRFRQGASLFDESGGWETVLDRGGNPVATDGVHISLSLIICTCNASVSLEHISQAAAGLKKQAKAQIGSVYVRTSL